jgi:predicted DNA-binding transcriptional regulator YafY
MIAAARRNELQRHLTRHGHSDLASLAREFGVSRRTVMRDLNALRETGLVIESDSGPGGGVRLDPASNVLRPRLKVEEIVGLILTVEYLRAMNVVPFAGSARTALLKIENTLPKERIKELRWFMSRILIGTDTGPFPFGGVQLSIKELAAIEQAFSERVNVRIRYRDASNRRTTRIIEPQALYVRFPAWYVIGYDPSKEGFRMFRADRIARVELLEERFTPRAMADVRSGYPADIF